MGFIPIRAEEAGAAQGRRRARARDGLFLAQPRLRRTTSGSFTRELATLLKAGLPLDRCFEILINLAANPRVGGAARPRSATRCAAAPRSRRRWKRSAAVFSRFYVNMIRAGEAGGSLPDVLLRLAEYMERSKALRDNVTASLIYPAILAVVTVDRSWRCCWAGWCRRFKPIFASAGKAVPFVTQVVLLAGDVVRNYGVADR